MSPPPSIRGHSPAMVQTGTRPAFTVTSTRKPPPPFLDDPVVREHGIGRFDAQSFETVSSGSLNPVHVHPMSTVDPFLDPKPMPNPFDDPAPGDFSPSDALPTFLLLPATPTVSEKRHSGLSVGSDTKSISSAEYGVAI